MLLFFEVLPTLKYRYDHWEPCTCTTSFLVKYFVYIFDNNSCIFEYAQYQLHKKPAQAFQYSTKSRGKYLFNQTAMANVFRARFLTALNEAGLSIPKKVPVKWVVDCSHVGNL